ncbi:MAG: hypothetical protein PVI40_03940 [Chlamydiota bacterium]|jgi:hypothetical protein|nr:MAG: hypothetical protein COT84_00185 [Chlamydiae bacterium CG10_big_fil_rev_8_21_14_0_10_35_9]
MDDAKYIELLEKVREYDFWNLTFKNELIRVEWDKGFHLSASVFFDKGGIPKPIRRFVSTFRSKNQRLWVNVSQKEVFLTHKFTFFGDADDFQYILDHFYEEILRWRDFFDNLSREDLVFISKK